MERLVLLACLSAVCVAQVLDPRGARPVVPNTRSEKCATQKEWPFCTTDEWGPKCPSGCRIHGLLEKYDHSFLKRVEKIRTLLDENQAKHRSTNQVSKQTYDFLKEKLTLDAGNDNNYFDLAQNLRRRITEMKIKIDQQLRVLAALKDKVKDQVADMKKLEVDIDIKLRSCKGSCKGHTAYEVDHESYVALDKQMAQLDSLSGQSIETVGTLYVMKSRDIKDAVVNTLYKSGDIPAAAQGTVDLFSDVNNVQLVLEQEGSINSPATISKDTGTSYSPSTSSTSSKSITELGGTGNDGLFDLGGDSQSLGQPSVTTQSSSCTRRVQTTIVQTSSGPVERTTEVVEGGPECQTMTDLTKGGSASLFPSLTSKTLPITDTKGGHAGDSKTTFVDPFSDAFDLGGFMTDNPEDDLPDIHARSVQSTRIERHADYVGKVCVRLKDRSPGARQFQTNRGRQCRRQNSDTVLCSDDDWVSKCPSGCRLQGLISQTEGAVDRKLSKICKIAETCEISNEKSRKAIAYVDHYNRKVVREQTLLEQKFIEQAQGLTTNLTSLRKRSARLSANLTDLRNVVQRQIEELLRAEVDIDMKLRACRGSCRTVEPFSTDRSSYDTLWSDLVQLDQIEKKKTPSPSGGVPHLRHLPKDPHSSGQRTVLFDDIGVKQLVLEDSETELE